jgi:hypothetical protein
MSAYVPFIPLYREGQILFARYFESKVKMIKVTFRKVENKREKA